ncbi:MAG: serine/threonine protein phosphatase [Bacteroidia bacterium]
MSEVKHKLLVPNSGKTWAIGDVHGYVNTLKTLVQKLNLQAEDRIVLLGDLVDRGPDVKGVFDFVIELQRQGLDIICIRGNHDDLMLKSHLEEQNNSGFMRFMKRDAIKKSWLNMGGEATMKSFNARKMVEVDPKYFEFIESMYHYVEDEEFLYVHAGFDFSKENPFTDAQSMMWIRDFKVDFDKTNDRKVVHGHTPLSLDFIQDVVANPDRDKFVALDNGIMIENMPNKGNLLAFETKSKTLLVQSRQD